MVILVSGEEEFHYNWNFSGWSDDDTITFTGGKGNDYVAGTAAADHLEGKGGNDSIRSFRYEGESADFIDGGDGVDIAILNRNATDANFVVDIRDGGGGRDIGDGTTLVNIERLDFYGGTGNDVIYGGDLDDRLSGVAGRSLIYGGGGNDSLSTNQDDTKGIGRGKLYGGDGNDYFYGGRGSTEFYGESGNDIFENLRDTMALNDDIMDGGTGNDLLILDLRLNTLNLNIDISKGGEGADIGDGSTITSIEQITFTGVVLTSNITGGRFAEWIEVWSSSNVLKGGKGNDYIDGDGSVEGADILDGGSGQDEIHTRGTGKTDVTAGLGADLVFLDEGADTVHFEAVADSRPGRKSDAIYGFDSGADKLDLSAIDAIEGGTDDAFTLIGKSPFSGAAGELRYFFKNTYWTVLADVDGDAIADFKIILKSTTTLEDSDFLA